MKTYRITATCNPYNARTHYNGGTILRRNGATPVEWVHQDNLTYTNAYQEFWRWASENCIKYSDETWQDVAEELGLEDYSLEAWKRDNPWYDGEGWYHCVSHEKCWDGGDTYRDDVMTYRIEEI